jgi:hypothetical protein
MFSTAFTPAHTPRRRGTAIFGKETFAMEVARTSMNVARVTVTAMIHGLTSGFQVASDVLTPLI